MQAAEEDRRALLCAFEKKLHSDRTAANKTIGKTVVKLLVSPDFSVYKYTHTHTERERQSRRNAYSHTRKNTYWYREC